MVLPTDFHKIEMNNLRRILRFALEYAWLLLRIVFGNYVTMHPIDPIWRWRYWKGRY